MMVLKWASHLPSQSTEKEKTQNFSAANLSRLSPELKLKLNERYKNAKKDVTRNKMKNRNVSSWSFNINAYSDHICLYTFRFRVADLLRIIELLHLPDGRISRKSYTCDKMTLCCIALKILSCSSNWMDLEITFRIKSSILGEMFW